MNSCRNESTPISCLLLSSSGRINGELGSRGQLRHTQASASTALVAIRPRFHVHFTPTYASWLNQVVNLLSFNSLNRRGILAADPVLA